MNFVTQFVVLVCENGIQTNIYITRIHLYDENGN